MEIGEEKKWPPRYYSPSGSTNCPIYIYFVNMIQRWENFLTFDSRYFYFCFHDLSFSCGGCFDRTENDQIKTDLFMITQYSIRATTFKTKGWQKSVYQLFYDGVPCQIESSPLDWFRYDSDLRHKRVSWLKLTDTIIMYGKPIELRSFLK